jgi:hypothetical protein
MPLDQALMALAERTDQPDTARLLGDPRAGRGG